MKIIHALLTGFAMSAFVIMLLAHDVKAEELTKKELVGELIFNAALIVDYAQTMNIKSDPLLHEKNPFLGLHPSGSKIRTYFILCAAGHYAVSKALPSAYRPYWQYGWVALQLLQIAKNSKVNANFSF